MDQVADLSYCDREPGEIEDAASPDVREELERSLDGPRVSGEPRLDTLARSRLASAGVQHFRRQRGLLPVDVIAEGRTRHRLPARLAGERDDPVAEPLQFE